MSSMASSLRTEQVNVGRIPLAGLIAALGAAAANAIVYLIAAALGQMPQSYIVPGGGMPITVLQPIISSTVGAIGATIVFALLARFTSRPITIFRIVALVVFILSFGTLLGLPGAPVGMVIALGLMHVVAAAIIVWALTTFSRRA
jgi:hypothetical protein